MQRRVVLLMALLLLVVPTAAHGVMTVSVGSWTLLQGVAGQTFDSVTALPIQLTATGLDGLGGANLRNYINGGVVGGPKIDGIQAGNATFAGSATAIAGPTHLFGAVGGFLGSINGVPNGVSPASNGLSTSGLSAAYFAPQLTGPGLPLMSFSFDTIGVAPGVYSWSLTNPLLGVSAPTAFLNTIGVTLSTILIDGTITVVPEPGSMLLCLFGAAGVGIVAIRRRRRRAA